MSDHICVCIIDDDKIFRFTTEKYLSLVKEVYGVFTFTYVEEAVSYFKKHEADKARLPDVVFLDVNMPIHDGWDFLEEYEKVKPGLSKNPQIYMVSTSIDERDRERARQYPDVVDFVRKPLDEYQLQEIVNTALLK